MKRDSAVLILMAGMASFATAWTCHAQAVPPPAPPPATNAPAPATGPKIRFLEPTFDFGRVGAGGVVKHEYKFVNDGNQTLEVTAVRPGCGCSMAGEWTRTVEPGQTGVVPVQFNSANFNGAVTKTFSVTCNDPTQATVVLHIKGTVWKPIDVTPSYAMFNIVEGASSNETRTVRIVNNLEEPLTVEEPVCTNTAFQAELKTVQAGKEFELVVKTVPPFSQRTVSSQITLKTSSTNLPVINVNAFATIQPAVVAYPPQIRLPQGPLRAATPYNVMVRNNASTPLTLVEPSINAEGVEIQVRETHAGRFYAVVVKFPAGFDASTNQAVELSLKTSNSQVPVIKVPVVQAPPPRPPYSPSRAFIGPPAPVRTLNARTVPSPVAVPR